MSASNFVRIVLYVVLGSCVTDVVHADDTRQDKLDALRVAYVDALTQSRKSMLKAFDDFSRKTKANRRLDIEEKLSALESTASAREAFSSKGTLPDVRELRISVVKYNRDIERTRDSVTKQYKEIAEQYGDDGELEVAKEVLAQLEELLKMRHAPRSAFEAGSRYSGFKFNPKVPDKKQQCVVEILKARGKTVQGTIAWHNNRQQETFRFPFQGIRDGQAVKFQIARDKLRLTFNGTAKDDSLALTFTGVGFGGDRIDGRAELSVPSDRDGLTK